MVKVLIRNLCVNYLGFRPVVQEEMLFQACFLYKSMVAILFSGQQPFTPEGIIANISVKSLWFWDVR